MVESGREEENLVLFETRVAKGRSAYKLFCSTIFVCILLIWLYRLMYVPRKGQPGRYAWMGMFFSEVLLGLYWILTQSARWNVVFRRTFKDRLSSRYQDKFPGIDIFVCTADPMLEPPSMVINTVLSHMSYNYPPDKISVYLSDDGGSEVTFYALLEASKFAKHWIPFCKKFKVEPRSPEAYFALNVNDTHGPDFKREWLNMKNFYGDMKSRIDSAVDKGHISEELRDKHKGFSEWDSKVTKQDHQTIIQILIDGWNPKSVDIEGNKMPTLVYFSREKRPGWPHNFKAGALNALIRISSEISNAPIVLTMDCDMYSNDPDAILDALCFFMDGTHGHEISYVQYPQRFANITKNDIYSSGDFSIHKIELAGLDGCGGAMYIGSGCFFRRDSLCGKKYSKDQTVEWNNVNDRIQGKTIQELEDSCKPLADCSYEKGTQWGKEMGMVYGFSVEDVVTGLAIQCKGWKPVYYIPSKNAFHGLAATTLESALLQYKRWAEGMFHIFVSKYCPFIYGHGKISLGSQQANSIYLLWAPLSVPALYYVIVPALSLVHNMPLFPEASSIWFVPFAYAFTAKTICSLAEDLFSGLTLKGWWNWQRMLVFRRMTSFLFGSIDVLLRQFGLTQTTFLLTTKAVDDDDALKRYNQEVLEFGSSSPMITIMATLALLNLFSLGWSIRNVVREFDKFVVQIMICGIIVALNLPVYRALFFRSDKGQIPYSVMLKSIFIASLAYLVPLY